MHFVLILVVVLACISAQSTNLALQKPSYMPKSVWTADKGNDGNSYCDVTDNLFFHTAHMFEPWWYVDLQAVYIITHVIIYNRRDCCSYRARNIEIATAITDGNWSRAAYYDGRTKEKYNITVKSVPAHYVKLTLKYIEEYFHLCEIEVYGDNAPSTNLALRKPSFMPTAWTADKGNDGNRNGDFYTNSCFHTVLMYEPWWYVDLQTVYIITSVEIYNRLDCCETRAQNIEIATAITNGSWSWAAYYDGGIDWHSHHISVNNVQARYVKLTLKGVKEWFHLCEIEVYGHNAPSTNLALRKPSHMPKEIWTADKGNDGNRNGDFYTNSCFHTVLMYEPWWYVDLQAVYIITYVEIYNRLDCCSNRVRNIEIATAITDGNWSRAAYYNGRTMEKYNITVKNVPAHYVKLTLKYIEEYFHLCEIEIYGDNAPYSNLAVRKPSYMPKAIWTADMGNDGNRNGDTCFYTAYMYEPWWYVDLQSIYIITRVDIYNKLDNSTYMASNIEIATAIRNGNWSVVAYHHGEVGNFRSILFKNVQARYVMLISKNIKRHLHLCEIEVYRYNVLQCPNDTDRYGIAWDNGILGKYMWHPCPDGYKSGGVKRLCDHSGKFHDPIYNCTRPAIEDIYRKLLDENIYINGTTDILDDLVNATSVDNATNHTLMIGDIDAVKQILTHITEITEVNSADTNKTINSFVEVANNIFREDTTMTWKILMNETGSGADAVIETLDHFLDKMATSKGEYTAVFTKSNLLVKLDLSGVCEKKIHFPDRQHDTLPAWAEDTADSIDVPCIHEQERKPYSVVMYRDVSEILPSRTSESRIARNIKLNAPVISFTFYPKISGKLDSPVEITFDLFDTTMENPRCTYWKKNNNSKNGFWSDEGCRLSEYNKKKNTVVCKCNHLTNFAVLMAPTSMRSQSHVAILGTISMTGCITSMICLSMTLLMYAIFWRNVRTATTVIKINLVLALFMAYLLFLTGIDKTKNELICTAIAVLLHLVYLVVFFTMLAEGICLAYSVYKPLSTRRPAVPLLIVAYILPCIIVGISTSVVQLEGYGSKTFCWLSTDGGLIWAFAVPVLTVILINFVIICLVIRKLCGTVAFSRKTDSERAKAGIRSVLVLMPVTGVTWVFGIFSVNEDTVIFQYLFAIFNSLQGVLIFVFHCVMNKQIQKAFYGALGVSTTGSSQTPETKQRSTEPKASQSADI